MFTQLNISKQKHSHFCAEEWEINLKNATYDKGQQRFECDLKLMKVIF